MKKLHLATITSFIVGISCAVAYRIIGSYVAPDGLLVEPFYLIPIGWLFIFIGIVLGVVGLAKWFLR